jgi:hypothetical protein
VSFRSGGGFEHDLVAEVLESADVVADRALGAGAGVVVVGSEVDEGGVLVGEQVSDGDQD